MQHDWHSKFSNTKWYFLPLAPLIGLNITHSFFTSIVMISSRKSSSASPGTRKYSSPYTIALHYECASSVIFIWHYKQCVHVCMSFLNDLQNGHLVNIYPDPESYKWLMWLIKSHPNLRRYEWNNWYKVIFLISGKERLEMRLAWCFYCQVLK